MDYNEKENDLETYTISSDSDDCERNVENCNDDVHRSKCDRYKRRVNIKVEVESHKYSVSRHTIVSSVAPISPPDLEVAEMMARNSSVYVCDSDDEITEINTMIEARNKLAAQLKLAESSKNKANTPPSAVSDSPVSELSKRSFNFDQVDDDIINEIIAQQKNKESSPTTFPVFPDMDWVPKVGACKDENISPATAQPYKSGCPQSNNDPGLLQVRDPQMRDPRIRNQRIRDQRMLDSRVHAQQDTRLPDVSLPSSLFFIPNYPPVIQSSSMYEQGSCPQLGLLPTANHYTPNPDRQNVYSWDSSRQHHLQNHANVTPIPPHPPTFNNIRYHQSQITSTDISLPMRYPSPMFEESNVYSSGIHTQFRPSLNVSVDRRNYENCSVLSTSETRAKLSTRYRWFNQDNRSGNHSTTPISEFKYAKKAASVTAQSNEIHTENRDSTPILELKSPQKATIETVQSKEMYTENCDSTPILGLKSPKKVTSEKSKEIHTENCDSTPILELKSPQKAISETVNSKEIYTENCYSTPILELKSPQKAISETVNSKEIYTENCDTKQDLEYEQSNVRVMKDCNDLEHAIKDSVTYTESVETILIPLINQEILFVDYRTYGKSNILSTSEKVDDETATRLSTNDLFKSHQEWSGSGNYSTPTTECKSPEKATSETEEIHTENCVLKQDQEDEQSNFRGFKDSDDSENEIKDWVAFTGIVETIQQPLINLEKLPVSIDLARLCGDNQSSKVKELLNFSLHEASTPNDESIPDPNEETTPVLEDEKLTTSTGHEKIHRPQTLMKKKSNEKRTYCDTSTESLSDEPPTKRLNECTVSLANDESRNKDGKGKHTPVVPNVFTSHLAPDIADFLRNLKEVHKCVRLSRKPYVEYQQCCYFCNTNLCLTKACWKNHIAKHAELNQNVMQFKCVTVKAYICDKCDYVRFNEAEIEKHLNLEHELDDTSKFKEVTFLTFPMKKRKCEHKKAKRQRTYMSKRKANAYKEECASSSNQMKSTAEKLSDRNNLVEEGNELVVEEQTMIGPLDPHVYDEGNVMTKVTENDDGPMEQIRVEAVKDDAVKLIHDQVEGNVYEEFVSEAMEADIEEVDLLTLIDEIGAPDLFTLNDETDSSELSDLLFTFIDAYRVEWPQLKSEESDIAAIAEQLSSASTKAVSREYYDMCLYALYKCMNTKCTFTTNNAENMLTHLQNHERNHQANNEAALLSYLECAYCDKVIDTCTRLVKHIHDEHQSSIFQCPYCFYRSCVAYNVVVHLNQFHHSEKKSVLVCNGKPKSYMTEKALIEKFLMENIRPLRCFEDCNKITYNMDYFVKHMTNSTTHTNKFKCQFCGLNTPISETAKHLLVHGVGVYECVYCQYGVNDVEKMQDHMCNVHPSKMLFICVRLTRKNQNLSDEQLSSVESTLIVDLDQTVDEELFQQCPNTDDPSQSNETSILTSLGLEPEVEAATSISNKSFPNVKMVSSSIGPILSYGDLEKEYMTDDWDRYFATLEYMTDDWDKHFATLSTTTQLSTSTTILSTSLAMVENKKASKPDLQEEEIQSSPSKRKSSTTMVEVTESASWPDLLHDDIDSAAIFLVKGTGLQDQDLYRCSFANCEYKSNNSFFFFDHLRSHNQYQTGFKCYHCSALSKNIVALKDHVKVHGIHRYFCFFCNYTSAIDKNVQKHMHLKHHRSDLETIPLNPKKLDKNVDMFVICPQGLRPQDLDRFHRDLIQRRNYSRKDVH